MSLSDFLIMLLLWPVIGAAFAWRAHRRRAAHDDGHAVRLRALLRGSAEDLPARFVYGQLKLGERPAWAARSPRRADPVDLTGARSLGVDPAVRSVRRRPTDAALLVALPDGTRLHLLLTAAEIPLVERALRESAHVLPAPTARAAGRPGWYIPAWSMVLLGLISAWAAFWVWMWAGGTELNATVTKPDSSGDNCRIQWNDPADGREQTAGVSCSANTKVGDTVRVLALPAPFNGEAGTIADSIGIPVGFGAAALLPTLGFLVVENAPRRRRRSHRRLAQLPRQRTQTVLAPSVPELGDGEVTYARIVELQRLRADAAGWDVTPRPLAEASDATYWWQVSALRRATRRQLPVAILPLLPVPMVARIAGQYWWLVVAAGLSFALLRVFGLIEQQRRLFAVREEQPRNWRYVRFVDPTGNPGLMLFSQFEDGAPAALLPLASTDAADGLPVDGIARVHGLVREGEALLPVIEGRPCWPGTPAQAVSPEAVRDLLNGYVRTEPEVGAQPGRS